ncbi:hypothetical protein NDU88_002181 [Pleurodeles waltl]|uniref:Uncharacterized protein n=1 Tax=Pleurodeles waltl TaxID=8319 RepID=A0AAV7W2J1_PLEWA|nr:hypothetical protein NDU88_002181 [Pleurodeles waltl]
MPLYPARMRVIYESQTHTLEEVLRWTDEKVGLRPHTPPHVDSDSSQGPDGSRRAKAFKKKRNRSRSTWRSRGPGTKTWETSLTTRMLSPAVLFCSWPEQKQISQSDSEHPNASTKMNRNNVFLKDTHVTII